MMRNSGSMDVSLIAYADSSPLSAMSAFGLGPLPSASKQPAKTLRDFQGSERGLWMAMETIGVTAGQIVSTLAALHGAATADQIAEQTRDADPADIADALDRLVAAGVVGRTSNGEVRLAEAVFARYPDTPTSLGDTYSTTNDVLAQICKNLQVKIPARKAERVAAIAGVFADPTSAAAVLDALPQGAIDLLERIATVAGPGRADPEDLGLASYQLRYAAPSPYNNYRSTNADPDILALSELTDRGIVGVVDWEAELWIWSEAWPLLDRPFHSVWPRVPAPPTAPAQASSMRIPAFVAAFDQVVRAWESEPPPVLKNGQHRIGKTQVKSTAKLLKLEPDIVDIAGRLAIGMELLLANVVAASGRGRKRRVDQAWMADAALLEAWNRASPAMRWARLVAEWCDPGEGCGEQLLVNRHLVLWELAKLGDGAGIDDIEHFGDWIGYRYGPVGHPDAVSECLVDLRALGVVESAGPVAFTPIGRMVLDDPTSLHDLANDEATSAFVQADLTVVAPPDLRHDLAARIASIADVESDSGAVVSRLSLDRMTRAVQDGDDAGSIIAFLTELSSVPLADTVIRLVEDAADRAGRVRVVSAPTVVVVGDPADLVIAISIKAAKLVKVSETVAISEVAHAKVRAALERKGLAPELVLATTSPSTPTRSSLDAARAAEKQAVEYREMASKRNNRLLDEHADALTARAERLADVDGRLAVTGTLAMTPAILAKLDPKATAKKNAATTKSATTKSATKKAAMNRTGSRH